MLHTDLIESTTQSHFTLSDLGNAIKRLVIVSDSAWPSWAMALSTFLESSDQIISITILTPSLTKVNTFGTSRLSKVKWRKLQLHRTPQSEVFNPKMIKSTLQESDFILYSGDLPMLQTLQQQLSKCQLDTPVAAVLPVRHHRLRKLQRCARMHWRQISHARVGGTSDGKFWLGSTSPLSPETAIEPKYCSSAFRDIAEFAPQHLHSTVHSVPPNDSAHRTQVVVPHPHHEKTYLHYGLLPHHQLNQDIRVVTPTPFTSTGWCSRFISTKEIARIFDVPVSIERKLAKFENPKLHPAHEIFDSVP